MKLTALAWFFASCAVLHGASVNDGVGLQSNMDAISTQDLRTLSSNGAFQNPAISDGKSLVPLSSDELTVVSVPAKSDSTAVPESAAAVSVAFFGFLLMFRRR